MQPKDMLNHFTLRNEYIFNRCYKNSLDGISAVNAVTGVGDIKISENNSDEKVDQLMTILDVDGIRFSDFNADVIRYLYNNINILYIYLNIIILW